MDGSQASIVKALRDVGALVIDTSRVGCGFTDLVVGWRKRWVLIEAKDGSKPPSARALTPDQEKFHAIARELGLPCIVVNSADEALSALGIQSRQPRGADYYDPEEGSR